MIIAIPIESTQIVQTKKKKDATRQQTTQNAKLKF